MPLATAHVRHTATLLPDGRVLVAGGYTAAAELWTPPTQLSADPGLAFGDHAAATTATLNITNTGDSPLFADGFAIGGANPADFAVDGSRCRGPIAPNATCAVDVRFAPTADGARSATLTFTANTAATSHALPLTGRGFTPAVDTYGDGVVTGDRCPTLKGPAARQGCPAGLLADPSTAYRPSGKGIRVLAYYVKATTGARVTVKCSKGCRQTSTKGKGAKRVRITRLNNRRLANDAKITITVSKPGRA